MDGRKNGKHCNLPEKHYFILYFLFNGFVPSNSTNFKSLTEIFVSSKRKNKLHDKIESDNIVSNYILLQSVLYL